MQPRPHITEVLNATDAAIAAAVDPTLAELLQELVDLSKRQREETDNAIKQIAMKINRINSAIK